LSPLLNRPSISEQAGAVVPHWGGRRGEAIAACWLWTRGCRILYRNYRGPDGGEVDLVCRHGQDLCFAEVKTRTGTAFGRPGLAVDEAKQRLIRRGAESWLRLLGCPEIRWRYDIVEVVLLPGRVPEVTWLQSAFGSETARAARRFYQ
jgi:putative endonuclease